MGGPMAPLTISTNNKPPKKYSLFISIILDFADLGRLHTLGGNASFHKGHNCSIEYKAETPYWPLHIPQKKVLAKMINLSHEEGLCHITDGRKSNNRRIQKSLMLPLAFSVIKINERCQKHQIGNTIKA